MFRSIAIVLLALAASPALAGIEFRVTSKDGDRTVKYGVKFGGGRLFEQRTAFDPVSGRFVYLKWNRGEAAPKSAGKIWDHQTGRTINLYKFPKVDHPLPVIPSIDAMKVCPKTGDPNFEAKALLSFD